MVSQDLLAGELSRGLSELCAALQPATNSAVPRPLRGSLKRRGYTTSTFYATDILERQAQITLKVKESLSGLLAKGFQMPRVRGCINSNETINVCRKFRGGLSQLTFWAGDIVQLPSLENSMIAEVQLAMLASFSSNSLSSP